MKKTNVSSPTRGNPYGRTGAPGKATEPQREPPGLDEAGAARALGRPMPAPSPQERTLQAAPPPRPQMPNLDALRMRGTRAGMQPTSVSPPPMRGGALPPGAGADPRFAPGPSGGVLPPGAAADPRFAPMQAAPAPDPRLQQLYAQYGIR